jgi:MFS family permease
LFAIGRGRHARHQTTSHGFDKLGLRKLLLDRRLLIFGGCVTLFHLANAGMLPLAAAAVTMRAGSKANLIIAACIMVPQFVVALCSPWVGRMAMQRGRRQIMLLGWGALPIRGLLLAVLPGPYLLVAGQAISGISAAVFGVMLPLVAADLTRGTSHFNLCLGVLGLAVSVGAALSTTMAHHWHSWPWQRPDRWAFCCCGWRCPTRWRGISSARFNQWPEPLTDGRAENASRRAWSGHPRPFLLSDSPAVGFKIAGARARPAHDTERSTGQPFGRLI